jgi:sugar lactone lactonase YvrE
MALDDLGNLLVADSANNTIRKVVIATGAVTTLAGAATQAGGPVDGTGALARIFDPCGLASDGAGNLFVASGGSTLSKVVIATGAVTTVVGSFGHAGVMLGPLPAALNTPRGLVVGPGGELYITDEDAILVARF